MLSHLARLIRVHYAGGLTRVNGAGPCHLALHVVVLPAELIAAGHPVYRTRKGTLVTRKEGIFHDAGLLAPSPLYPSGLCG